MGLSREDKGSDAMEELLTPSSGFEDGEEDQRLRSRGSVWKLAINFQ